uniref:Lipocalin/cytosolic fatty-acid binding domain-containing protein n=1 Tax=Clastoptera arizonana TaxID=38151 RepID=A0A1B6DQQ1_9HEMI
MLTCVVWVFGLACSAYARDCASPNPVDTLLMDKFSGLWIIHGFTSANQTQRSHYKSARCAYEGISQISDKLYSYFFEIFIGDDVQNITGYLQVLQPGGGHLKRREVKNADFLEHTKLLYDYYVICVDYNKWTVVYDCAPIQPGLSSENIFLFGRPDTTYKELISMADVNDCLAQVVVPPVEGLIQITSQNCPNKRQ